ncbi:uncharacterized protein BCR38DRAFT_296206, partial [Pseudomassariella vexata]
HHLELLHFFAQRIAPAFDFGNQQKSFTRAIFKQATRCPALSNAILAVSAKGFHPMVSTRPVDEGVFFRHECLRCLTTVSVGCSPGVNEDVSAVAVLVQFFDQIQAPIQDHCALPRSLSKCFEVCKDCSPPFNELREAVFMIDLRQKLYLAVMHRKPTNSEKDQCIIDKSLTTADDKVWTQRIIWHFEEVIQYCFGYNQTFAEYEKLVEYAHAWERRKPDSFDPIFIRGRNGENPFPEVILLSEPVVLGLQYYFLTHLLLTAYDPSVPRLVQGGQRAPFRSVDVIRNDVRMVCGIAESIDRMNPSHIAACMAIALAGDRFTDHGDQESLLDILVGTEREYRWSTSQA